LYFCVKTSMASGGCAMLARAKALILLGARNDFVVIAPSWHVLCVNSWRKSLISFVGTLVACIACECAAGNQAPDNQRVRPDMQSTELTWKDYAGIVGGALVATVCLTAYFLSPWVALAVA
jgi:hypothetical protein